MTINDHIRQRYPHEPTDLIARDLNISIRKVYNRAFAMGLKKTYEYIKTHQPGCADLKERGKATRFKKGDTPHNKGVPMSSDVYERVKHTMFKKGGKPQQKRLTPQRKRLQPQTQRLQPQTQRLTPPIQRLTPQRKRLTPPTKKVEVDFLKAMGKAGTETELFKDIDQQKQIA